MLVDKLAAKSGWIRGFCRSSRVIQAPFAVFPPQESKLQGKTSLIPRNGGMISGQFAKPPFERTIILGDGSEGLEQGALFVQSSKADEVKGDLLPLAPEDTTHVLLVTVAGFTQRFECLVAYRLLAFSGMHFSAPRDMELVTNLSRQAFFDVNGFLPCEAGTEIRLDEKDWKNFVQHQVGALAALFALMSCKNVVREVVACDQKLQRARKKAGKLPLCSYSTLKMKPIGGSGTGLQAGKARAIHWIRGHFKEYTPERPLFGKVAGLFWWEPHLAGTAGATPEEV